MRFTGQSDAFRSHPARFSDPILPVIGGMLEWVGATDERVLDPFAGVGRIHELRPMFETVGIEIEPEWASVSPFTVVGNALYLPFRNRAFRFAATSPCYGNRMADSHNAKERCKKCKGEGHRSVVGKEEWGAAEKAGLEIKSIVQNGVTFSWVDCEKCGGKGYRSYTRLTYTHKLRSLVGKERKLHRDNAGAMQWGPKYRAFHESAWAEMSRVVTDVFILNIKDHYRTVKGEQVLQPVTRWHIDCLTSLGWDLVRDVPVECRGMGMGANRDVRDEFEHVLLFERSDLHQKG